MNVGPFHKHRAGELISRFVFLLAILVVILDAWLWRP